tara:strand:- start:1046 stop:1459 length:414 start_codon:yes stop_codon:yes gene_type:complete
MLVINNLLLTFLPILSISDPNARNILPPINNVYKTTLNVPLLGKQNIQYKRIGLLESEVKLDGKLNAVGYIYFDKTNVYNYKFDNTLKDIVKKYRCTIYNPYYDKKNDLINFKIKINIIQFQKTLVLKNINQINCIT